MELTTLHFLLSLSVLFTGTLSKQGKDGFKSTLHDNMKEYFKSYMVGNFKGVAEKEFDSMKLSKWIGEGVSKRSFQSSVMGVKNIIMGIIAPNYDLSKIDSILNTLKETEGSILGRRENTNEDGSDILAWVHEVSDLRQKISSDIDSFFKSWDDVLNALPNKCDEAPKVPSSTPDISLLGVTPGFMNLFWPFRFDMNIMNQRLAVSGSINKIVTEDNETLKLDFFEELQDLQAIRLPVEGNQLTLSFGDEDIIDGLNRSHIVPLSKSYVKAKEHLFTKDEQTRIRWQVNKALDLINKTHAELYSAMVQMVSCIAFVKDEAATHMSGTANSAIGLIWLNPQDDWTVPVMAEQIVHEFIHTSLCYAQLVHGGYKDVSRLSEVKAMSSLRHEPRDYDKSLHAAYVSAGLIAFHTRAGVFDRAADLAQTLPGSVKELNRVNSETDVLDETGRAMLNFLTNYVCLMSM